MGESARTVGLAAQKGKSGAAAPANPALAKAASLLHGSRMELRHLRYFHAVADTLNFSRAAERLRVAQPALSRQVRDLEAELGVVLLQRSTSQVRLTDAGRHFLEETRELLRRLEEAVQSTRRVGAGVTGELNIGSDWNLPAPIAAAARQLLQDCPGLAINFVELPSHEHIAAVLDGRIHVGFVASRQIGLREGLEFLHILSSPMRILLPLSHPRAEERSVPLRALRDERWIALDEARYPGFRALMSQIMRPAQFTPRFGRTTGSLQGMAALVTAGEGVVLLPEAFMPADRHGFHVLETDCDPYELLAVWRADTPSRFVAEYAQALHRETAGGR